MKKFLAVLLTGVMLLSVTACGFKKEPTKDVSTSSETETQKEPTETETQKEPTVTDEPKVDDSAIPLDAYAGTELTVAILRDDLDKSTSMYDKTVVGLAEEELGIKFNWIEVDNASKSEMVSVLLSGDMPDVMIGLVSENDIATNMDLFYDLSEDGLLETYAPNIYSDILASSAGIESLIWGDGSIRSLMTGNEYSATSHTQGIFFINKAWIDQLGLDMPNSADSFYETLRAFQNNDMNGNGDTTDEIPFTFCESQGIFGIHNFMNFWGLASQDQYRADFMYDGETISSTVDTEEYRAYLEYSNMLASEGLLDVEGFSQTYEQFTAKLSDGLVGCFYGWTPSLYMDAEMAKNYVACTPFNMIDGVNYVQNGIQNKTAVNRIGIVFSAKTENIEACLHWWNYLGSSTEMKFLSMRGPQGESWDVDEDGKCYSWSVTSDNLPSLPEGWTASNYCYTHGLLHGNKNPALRADEIYVQQVQRVFDVQAVFDYISPIEYMMPLKFTGPEYIDERSFIQVEYEPVVSNFLATSIVDGVTDASWKAYLQKLETSGYYDYLDWYKSFVAGEFMN